jgi:hypothetical protein
MESRRPVAGEYQAGCRPVAGSRRVSPHGTLRTTIPSRTAGWPAITKLPAIVTGPGMAPAGAVAAGVGGAVAVAGGWWCGRTR